MIGAFIIRERNGMDMMSSFMLFVTMEAIIVKQLLENNDTTHELLALRTLMMGEAVRQKIWPQRIYVNNIKPDMIVGGMITEKMVDADVR